MAKFKFSSFTLFTAIAIIFCAISLSSADCKYGYYGKNCDECGVSYSSPNVKISGGIEAKPHSWPSMAVVIFRYEFYLNINGKLIKRRKTGLCSGSLISRNTVLTAAHCKRKSFYYYYNNKPYLINIKLNGTTKVESLYTIYLGVHNITEAYKDLKLSTGVSRSVREFKIHPKYYDLNAINDIGIIKLSKEVELNKNIQIACLPKVEGYPSKTNIDVLAAGYGTLKLGGPLPFVLYNVKMKLYDKSYCRDVNPNGVHYWQKQICAGRYKGGKDTCSGDSGGPLFVKTEVNNKRKFVVVGITSYGDGCAVYANPGIYTRVSSYLEWIHNNS